MGEQTDLKLLRWANAVRQNAAWLVLAISLAVTGGSTVLVWRASRGRDEVRFRNEALQATTRALDGLELYKSMLRGAASLMSAEPSVSPEEFAAFARRQNLAHLYPGVLGIGWTPVPLDVDTAYLAPPALRGIPALGPAAAEVRRRAMENSRDRGGAQLTNIVPAGDGVRQAPGFLLYLPVYSGPVFPPPTVVRRRAELLGFVFAPISATEFFRSVFHGSPDLRVALYDGRGFRADSLLYTSGPARSRSRFRFADTLFVTGHAWTVVLESTPAFEDQLAGPVVPYTLAGGLLATLLIFGLAWSLTRAAHAAEAANRAKSAFLATMSHELRTPLNAIMGYADLLDMGVPEPVGPMAREQVGRIRAGAKHLLELIESVLQLARTEAHMETPRLEMVDVTELIESVVQMTVPLAARKGLKVEHRPGGDMSAPVRTDPRKLRQICINVVGNAIKFTPAGQVVIETSRDSHDLLVRVTDTGIGIAPEHRELVFDAFWQADRSHTRTAGGAGLGLAVSRNLARLLGGDLTCESEPGRGSTFTLRLPLEGVAAAEEKLPATPV